MEDNHISSIIKMDKVQFAWASDKKPILDIPEFQLSNKENIFIHGPSGSGKTTLLGLLGGVLTPQTGDMLMLGKKLNILSGAVRDSFRAAHIGFIFQMFNLLPYLSVVENVLLPCRFSRERKQKAMNRSNNLKEEAVRLLSDLGLKDAALLSRPVTELSMGQQQRVAAARALIGNPEILIADEPTSSLDADSKEFFLELLFKECREFGTTLIFVSHDVSLAGLFDRTLAITDINHA